jgi:hypothetical protein
MQRAVLRPVERLRPVLTWKKARIGGRSRQAIRKQEKPTLRLSDEKTVSEPKRKKRPRVQLAINPKVILPD